MKYETLTALKEEYCKVHGWEKSEGYKLDMSQSPLPDEDFDEVFISKEEFNDFATETSFWHDPSGSDESAYDDIDELIEYIEENLEDSRSTFKQYAEVRSHDMS